MIAASPPRSPALKQTFLDFEQPIAELQAQDRRTALCARRFRGRHLRRDHPPDQEEPAADQGNLLASCPRGRSRRSRAIRSGPTRSTTSPACSPISTSCTAIAPTATTRRSSAAWRASTAQPCMVLGHQKGRDTKEKIHRNFGMPRPEGYRKALRLMKLAEKFELPLFTFVDTPGAYPGHRRRGARAVGGHRPQSLRNGRAAHSGHRHGDRRRRLRRRARDRHRRCDADAAVRDVLGDLARGLRVDPVEVRRHARGGRRDARHHRAAPQAARPHRQGRHASRWAAPIAITPR